MGITNARRLRHLARAGIASQLQTQLVNLAQAGCADRLPVGKTPAIGVDG